LPPNCVTLLRVSTDRRTIAENTAGPVRLLRNVMNRIREVRKRDSRVVPFDLDKISDAIHRAQLAVGAGDRAYARELAEVVEHFLTAESAGGRRDGVPHIEEIQDVVEKVLMARPDCGEAAKSYILYRRKREILRETLEVRRERDPGAGRAAEAGGLPSVEKTDAGVSGWSKSRITAALIREADLDPAVAEEIAASVEAKVLRTGILLISTALIRELVDNELFERGYDAKLKKQAPLSLPRYDIEQLIRAEVRQSPRAIEKGIARQLLLQYSLGEMYSPEVARGHRNGRFYLHSLGNPLRYYRLLSDWNEDLGDRLPELQEQVSREILVSRAESSGWRRGMFSKGAVFQLDCADSGCLEALEALVEAVRAEDSTPALVIRLRQAELGELPVLASRLCELVSAGATVSLLPPGCGRFPDDGIVAGKVTLNLPRAAYRSARDSAASIESELDELVDLAVKGLLEKTRFLSRLHSGSEESQGALSGGLENEAVGIVGLVGLNECVSYLVGSQLHESAAALDKGRELVARLGAKLEAEQRRLGLRLVLEESLNRGELLRLQEMDGRLYPEYVTALAEAGHLYTDGVRTREEDPLKTIEFDAVLLRSVVPRGGVVGKGLDLGELGPRRFSEFLAEALTLSARKKQPARETRKDSAITELKK